jgi:hypothetical protein
MKRIPASFWSHQPIIKPTHPQRETRSTRRADGVIESVEYLEVKGS